MEYSFNKAYVKTKQGILQGTIENEQKVFRGVPYAAPPIGKMRWKAPTSPARWLGVREAKRFSAGALQVDIRGGWESDEFELSSKMDSEDCLYLNIWSPAKEQTEKKPVFVWVHGGGMVAGTGMASFFEGEKLAANDIIVVTINYRLGLFGFFCHPELSAEAPYGSSGNYALLDIRQAILWLKENIAQFGGDPDKITVGGQSGGSVGTSCLLMSPLVKDLCQGVIMESGCPYLGGAMDPKPLKIMEEDGVAFASKIECNSLEQLREMDGCDLLEKSLDLGYTPNYCVDGYFLPDSPYQLFSTLNFNDFNFMVGFTSEEFGSLHLPENVDITTEEFEMYVNTVFPAKYTSTIIAHYPHINPAQTLKSLLRLQGDLMFVSAGWLGEAGAKKGSDGYVFYKTRPDAGAQGERVGSTHSSELPYLFGRTEKCNINPAGLDETEQAFGAELVAYWVNFIKTGCPNGNDTKVAWPKCTSLFEYLDLGKEMRIPTQEDKVMMRLFDTMLREENETTARKYMDMRCLGEKALIRFR